MFEFTGSRARSSCAGVGSHHKSNQHPDFSQQCCPWLPRLPLVTPAMVGYASILPIPHPPLSPPTPTELSISQTTTVEKFSKWLYFTLKITPPGASCCAWPDVLFLAGRQLCHHSSEDGFLPLRVYHTPRLSEFPSCRGGGRNLSVCALPALWF